MRSSEVLPQQNGAGRTRGAAPGRAEAHEDLPPISVVVCTRDRPDELPACLASLQALDYPQFEVIVVDNAPTSEEGREIVARSSFRYEREERPGLNWARCRGACVARYEIIAFTDDDARVDPGWLHGIARAFAAPSVLGVTGLVLPFELETQAQRFYERYGTGMSRGSQARTFVPSTMSWLQLVGTQAIGVGANMAFRRRAFVLAGEFDTALDAGTPSGGAGDLDMFQRLLRAGGEIRYEPSALVRHRHRREMPELAAQLRANGRSFGVYLLKSWRQGGAARVGAAAYAFMIWLPWLVFRLMRGAIGSHALPLTLLWAELHGALEAPSAFRRTYEHDRELRRSIPNLSARRRTNKHEC